MRTSIAFRIFFLFLFLGAAQTFGQRSLDEIINRELPRLMETYRFLHANPEISYQEVQTSAFIAKELRKLGFDVTERFGDYGDPGRASYGVVAVLRNGPGPTVLVRTDLDALPVEEKTGLPFASKVRTTSEAGQDVGVMHACGHDIHMSSFLGTAAMLSEFRDRWKGTLVLIGQPSEERGAGAHAMLRGGLYEKFPRPDYLLALHDSESIEAGKVGICEGFVLANVTSVDLIVRGVGGHGAYPHQTKDPIVLASQIVLALQTIVSREKPPLDAAVVTVGSIHGGTKHNIIPEEVRLQLTIRSYKEELRKNILASIRRIVRGTAIAAGVPDDRMPIVDVDENEYTAATYNNPQFTKRVSAILRASLGKDNLVSADPVMGAEDFGAYSLNDSIPLCIFWLGTVNPATLQKSRQEHVPLPSLHSSQFAPDAEPTIQTGVKAMSSIVLDLMKR